MSDSLLKIKKTQQNQYVLRTEPFWDPALFSQSVASGLAAQGLETESVQALAPCSVAETLLSCTRSAAMGTRALLALSKETYGLDGVSIEFPAEGWAELHGHIAGDSDALLICPAFTFIEPTNELEKYIAACCASEELTYAGAFSLAGPTSSRLQ